MDDTEEVDYVAPEHDRLVSALTKLDKTQHIKEPTRNEPTNLNSEFNLIKKTNKININNVVKVLEDTAHNVQIGKKLKKSQETTKVLPKPLEKPQAERVKRATGYEAAKKKVGRWDPVIARNRTVDYVSFPLKHVSTKLQPTKDFLSKLVLKSPLEKELDAIDPPPEPEQEEEEPVYPMSYEEMVEQRQHLAKIRARQSYTAAKAKRQSKIKSKKFHRVLKKEKLKQQLKEFEELQQKDPEEALKKLEALEKVRALERHTLRHKNTGKWAKSKLVRAKYDKEVRQQLAEQLSVGRGLTHKTKDNAESSDDDGDVEETSELTLSQDPTNPWMMKNSGKSNVDAEFDFGYKKYLQGKTMFKRKDESDTESDIEQNTTASNDLESLKLGINKLQNVNKLEVDDEDGKLQKTKMSVPKTKQKINKKKSAKVVATSNWTIETIDEASPVNDSTGADIDTAFDSYEDQVAGKVQRKLNQMRKQLESMEKQSKNPETEKAVKVKPDRNSLEYYSFKNQKMKQIIDEQLIETNSNKQVVTNPTEGISAAMIKHIQEREEQSTEANANIDPTRFIEVKPKYLNTTVVDSNQLDELDDDEQVVPKVNIEDVFEEDDVVASFRQEKQDEINKNTPQDIDLSLPGWGSWGGKGIKPTKRKRNRFIMKAAPKVPRRDENKGDIIIKELKNPQLTLHKVNDVPFPFTSVKDYEASIRAPIGNTFIPETAHQKLIKPSVITKAGAIIEPMDEEELLVKKNRTFKNESIIRLVAKK